MGFYPHFLSYIFWLLFPKAGFTLMYSVFYFLVLNVSFYCSWLFIHKTLKLLSLHSLAASLVGAVLYNFSTFAIFMTAGGVIDGIFPVICLIPCLSYILIKMVIEGPTTKNLLSVAILTALALNAFSYSFAVIGVFLSSTIFLINWKAVFKSAHKIVFSLGVSLATAALFITSMLGGVDFFGNKYDPGANGLTGYTFLRKGITDVFRLIFDWYAITDINSADTSFYFLHLHPLGTIGIFLIWGFFLYLFIKGNLDKKRKLFALFVSISLLIAIFVTKGSAYPFSFLNDWLYGNIPFFGIFRTPGTKFGYIIYYLLALVIAYVFALEKNKKIRLAISIVVFLEVISFFLKHPRFSLSAQVNSPKPTQEQTALITKLNSFQSYDRILFLPGLSSAHFQFGEETYTVADIIGRSTALSSVYQDGFYLPAYFDFYQKLIQDLSPKLLGKYSIRYVLIREDFSASGYPTFKKLAQLYNRKLRAEPQFKLIYHSKNYNLYELEEGSFKPIVYIKNGSREYFPKLTVKSPNLYTATFPPEAIGNGALLYFNALNYSNWEIEETTKPSLFFDKLQQAKVNVWQINTEGANAKKKEYTFVVNYRPQKILNYGALISAGALLSTLIFLVLNRHKI